MTKAEKIMEMVKEGKTFQEIVDSGQKEKYVQIILGKNGYDWKTMKLKPIKGIKADYIVVDENSEAIASEPQPISNGTGYGQNPFDEDAEMEKMEVQAKAMALSSAMKQIFGDHAPELNNDALVEVARQMTPEKQVRKEVEKCHRHPMQNVKPGENCPICIESSIQHERIVNISNHAPPCPKCGATEIYKMGRNGGIIKVLRKKKGHYGCGNCQISYNVKGECVPWGDKDASFYV